jgi:hypothetical protein
MPGQLANEPLACNINSQYAGPGRWHASSGAPMFTRSHNKTVAFVHPFELKGVDRVLPPGNYRVVTDEELIEELSFPVYRRVSTMIFVPGETYNPSVEMVTIDPLDLQAALDRDSALPSEPDLSAETGRPLTWSALRRLGLSDLGKPSHQEALARLPAGVRTLY